MQTGHFHALNSLSLRSDLSALAHVKGAWTIFLNLNPSNTNSALMFELSRHKYNFDKVDIKGLPVGLPSAQEGRVVVAKNPIAAAKFYWTCMKCFVRLFFGLGYAFQEESSPWLPG